MEQNDLQNILVLARKGLQVASEGLTSEQGIAAWTSINKFEQFIKENSQKQEA